MIKVVSRLVRLWSYLNKKCCYIERGNFVFFFYSFKTSLVVVQNIIRYILHTVIFFTIFVELVLYEFMAPKVFTSCKILFLTIIPLVVYVHFIPEEVIFFYCSFLFVSVNLWRIFRTKIIRH